jgi:hypothetical protein
MQGTNEFNLFNNQPDEIIGLYLKFAGYNPESRLVNSRLINIYDDLAQQKYKLINLTQGNNIPPLSYKWLYTVNGFVSPDEVLKFPVKVLKFTYSLNLRPKELVEHLRLYPSMVCIDIGEHKLRDYGTKALALALEHNTCLTSLNLAGNAIGDEAIKVLVEILESKNKLISLNLGFNHIMDDGAKALATALERHTSLTN